MCGSLCQRYYRYPESWEYQLSECSRLPYLPYMGHASLHIGTRARFKDILYRATPSWISSFTRRSCWPSRTTLRKPRVAISRKTRPSTSRRMMKMPLLASLTRLIAVAFPSTQARPVEPANPFCFLVARRSHIPKVERGKNQLISTFQNASDSGSAQTTVTSAGLKPWTGDPPLVTLWFPISGLVYHMVGENTGNVVEKKCSTG
jgi:hypothetical protein